MPLFCKYTVHCADTLHHWVSLAIPVQGSDHNNNNKFLSPHHHHYYEVIISFTEVAVVTFGPFRLSLMSLRKTERFWVNLSLFFVNKVLSIPSIKFSNLKKTYFEKTSEEKGKIISDQVIMAALLSACWEAITWSLKFWGRNGRWFLFVQTISVEQVWTTLIVIHCLSLTCTWK